MKNEPLSASNATEIMPKISRKDLHDRRAKAAQDKLSSLFDYYAKTDLSAETVAHHIGLIRQEQVGTDQDGKPVLGDVLDVERAAEQLAWRRKAS